MLLDYYLIITEEVGIEELVLRNKPKNSDIRPAYTGNPTAYFCDLIERWLTNKWAMPIELYLLIMFCCNVFFHHFSTLNR
ncbi:hypothetical protein [Enterococcus hirae]|uniref:hypothetical protein n=1 Tax=Enterococcus hirae TaxID=1354 RepID=UPI0012D7254C|nr:hypothetical protein [Enterococcus hirae]MBE8787028.1 hypothetical protein [Enterococcus hirae]MBE8805533.1 hypothetical protein [Enterococcus hirae]MCC4035219.1 hypothetical protein [Enterococcus hirae]NBA39950.1 hypothetical protein [Enterococcus hirae]NBA56173.1 hypothetical protein [Enterococcus hirae]